MHVEDPESTVVRRWLRRRARDARHLGALWKDRQARRLWALGVPAGLALFVVSAVIVEAVDEWLVGRKPLSGVFHLDSTIELLVGLAVVRLCYTAYRRSLEPSHAGHWDWLPLLATVIAIGLHGTGFTLLRLLEEPGRLLVLLLTVYVAVLTPASFLLTADVRHRSPAVRHRLEGARLQHRPHLVLFLSRIIGLDASRGWPEALLPRAESGPLARDLQSFQDRKHAGNGYWSWEPVLAAINVHREAGVLRTVTVVPSLQSVAQVEWFAEIVEKYPELEGVTFGAWLPGAGSFRLVPLREVGADTAAIDFENFTQLGEGTRKLIGHLRRAHGAGDDEVTIDFTGGQKPTSVAAAVASFNTLVQGQYVQTNRPWDVIAYDIVTDPDVPTAG